MHIGLNKDKFLFILKSSKTHTKGNKPQLIKLTRDNKVSIHPSHGRLAELQQSYEVKYCPFKTLQEFIQIRPPAADENEQFFVFLDRLPVKPNQMRSVLRTLLTRMQMEARLYNLHSFRIGRCSDLLKYGFSVETIKHLGWWKSNTVFKYLRS